MVDEDSSTSGGGKGLEAGGAARDRDPLEDAGEDAEPQQPAGLSAQRVEAGTENRSDRIAEILKQDQVVPRKQRHSAKRIFERIRDKGYSGGYTRVKEAVREIKQTRREEFVPLVHRPGEAQVDFGHALAKAGGNLEKIVFFVMCLPHSDAVHMKAFPRICADHENAGTGEPRTTVSLLPYVIDTPGSYYVTTNLTGAPTRPGISIEASDVTLDLGGFTLLGVTGALEGILAGNSATLSECSAIDNGMNGIYVNMGSTISACTALGNSSNGISAVHGGSSIHACTTRNNSGDGIATAAGTVVRYTSTSNGDDGIDASFSSRGTQCASVFNLGDGIQVTFDGRVAENNCDRNGNMGGTGREFTSSTPTTGSKEPPCPIMIAASRWKVQVI